MHCLFSVNPLLIFSYSWMTNNRIEVPVWSRRNSSIAFPSIFWSRNLLHDSWFPIVKFKMDEYWIFNVLQRRYFLDLEYFLFPSFTNPTWSTSNNLSMFSVSILNHKLLSIRVLIYLYLLQILVHVTIIFICSNKT